jgi:hypothetical protein
MTQTLIFHRKDAKNAKKCDSTNPDKERPRLVLDIRARCREHDDFPVAVELIRSILFQVCFPIFFAFFASLR